MCIFSCLFCVGSDGECVLCVGSMLRPVNIRPQSSLENTSVWGASFREITRITCIVFSLTCQTFKGGRERSGNYCKQSVDRRNVGRANHI